ncbi:MAG: hypothetical protein R3Y32_06910 [Bacillota bacterium]
MINKKKYSETTMKNWSKDELIDYIRMLEHNNEAIDQRADRISDILLQVYNEDEVVAKALDKFLIKMI